MLVSSLHLELLAVLRTPLVNICLKLTNVRPEGHDIIVIESPVDCVVHVFSGDFSTILLRVPYLDREDSRVINPACHQGSPVLRLRSIKSESNTVTLLKGPETRYVYL